MPYPLCICVGDSITQLGWRPDGGYVAALAHEYNGKMDVVNRGYGGYTSHQLVAKLKDDFFTGVISKDSDVRLIVLNIGTNDCVERGPSKRTGNMRNRIPLNDYGCHLTEILSIFQRTYPKAHILVITPSIVSFEAWRSFQLKSGAREEDAQRANFDRSMTSAVIYRGLCLEVAWSNRSVAVVDAFKAHQAALEHEKLSEAEVVEDGVHFSGLGYQIVWERMKEAIINNWPDLNPEVLPQAFMQWDEYAGGDPEG